MRLLGPLLGDQQGHIPAADIDRPVEDPLGAIAGDRDPDLLADVAVAAIQWRRLGDDRLVEHQQHGAGAALQPALQPPVDCRQVLGRRANSCRGRFHRMPRRSIARPTVRSETSIAWRSCRYRPRR